MKILAIVPYVPDLVRVRPYQFMRHLVLAGHEVRLLTVGSPLADGDAVEELKREGIQVELFNLPKIASYANCLLALPTRTPLQALYCWQPKLARRAAELWKTGRFDVIHIEHLRGAQYGLELHKKWSAFRPAILWDSVDNISHLFRQAVRQDTSALRRFLRAQELRRTERYERILLDQFNPIAVTSPVDRQAFLEMAEGLDFSSRVRVIPNGVDLDYFFPGPQQERQPNTIVVSGKMSYHANVRMVKFLVEQVMPRVWLEIPDASLWVVGKDPPEELRALGQDRRITVTGTVPDLRPYLQRAAVAVASITYGAGIQNKVLEALACATPMVASRMAVSALNVVEGTDLLVGEDAPEIAGQLVTLLKDAGLRQRVGAAGREFVQREHSWQAMIGLLEGAYHVAIDHAHSGI